MIVKVKKESLVKGHSSGVLFGIIRIENHLMFGPVFPDPENPEAFAATPYFSLN